MSHFVYRCFDSDGLLLYVGCAGNVARRLTAHRASRTAFASRALQLFMASHTVEGPFETRGAAEAAEQAAIEAESPLLNLQHSRKPNWHKWSRVVGYLEQHDRPLSLLGLRRCPECDIPGVGVEGELCWLCVEILAEAGAA